MSVTKESFRPDIAGLRALAVMLVLFSHFEIPGFEFGFIGVDIFFVISGFLITRVLYRDYLSSSQGADNKATLSLGTFYLRRIRRLLPAAMVVIVLVNITSFFLYNPEARKELLVNSKWALFFLANVSFLRSEADYFQQTNEPSMLQHYWSLSVEEQFYFIWPLLFLVAASLHKMKFRGKYFRFNKRILFLIGLVSLTSYIFLQYGFRLAPSEAYFSIFTRAWELGVGSFLGILAFHKKPDSYYSRTERYLSLLLALVVAALMITRDNWAVLMPLPVIATGIVLYTGQNQALTQQFQNKFVKVIGKLVLHLGAISYSLYLVHWPLYILAVHYQLANGIAGKLALFPISFIAAHLLWKFVETPFQKIALPKKSSFEDFAFNFVKLRRLWIGSISLLVIGSLYLVTYPSVSGRLVYSDSKLTGLAEDPAIQKYSNYQANLLNPTSEPMGSGTLLYGTETTSSSALTLPELIAINEQLLREGLTQNELTKKGQLQFLRNSEDKSPFELSNCGKMNTAQAPDCSTGVMSKNQKKLALIGDSKMGQFAQPIIDYYRNKGWRVVPYIMFGCVFYSPNGSVMTKCAERSDWVKAQLQTNSYDLVISATYPGPKESQKAASAYFDFIRKYSRNQLLLVQYPQTSNPQNCISADFSYKIECSQINPGEIPNFESFRTFLNAKSNTSTYVIDTTRWTCIKLQCPIVVGDTFLTRDGSHLTYTFIKKITPILHASLDSLNAW